MTPPPQKKTQTTEDWSFLEGQKCCLILLILFIYGLLLNIVNVTNAKLRCSFNIPHFHLWLTMPMCARRGGGTCSSQQPSAGWGAAALPPALRDPWQFMAEALPRYLLQFLLSSTGDQTSCQLCFSYCSGINLAVPYLNFSYSVTVPVSVTFKDC